jgi:hypothetical protein
MNLSYVQKLLIAADPFSVKRTDLRAPKTSLAVEAEKPEEQQLLCGRHLTSEQLGDISNSLQDSITGPVSMTATASDKEAVCYEGEIAKVLKDTGFKVEIDNMKKESSEREGPTGLQMTIKEDTVRPIHASRIVRAFRSAGVAIATRINGSRRKNNTLYIEVGPKGTPSPSATQTAAEWQSRVARTVLGKWKAKFSSGLRRLQQDD